MKFIIIFGSCGVIIAIMGAIFLHDELQSQIEEADKIINKFKRKRNHR